MASGSPTQPTPDHVGDRLAALRRAVRAERRRVADEQQAFAAFRKRLADIDPRETVRPAAPTPLLGDTDADATSSTPGLCAVRDAYEETVMSVPHYVEDYDDTYPESLAAEFGRELSATLTTGTAFDPAVKQELQRVAGIRRESRAVLLDTLDTEADSLGDLHDRLPSLAHDIADLETADLAAIDFGALEAHHARAETLRERCNSLAKDRQATLRRQRRELHVPGDDPDVPRYLYVNCDATYPVLSTIAELAARGEAVRSRVETAIADW